MRPELLAEPDHAWEECGERILERHSEMALPGGTFRPGQIVPVSGQVREVGYRNEATVVKGERFPPTRASGGTWRYVDVTRHGR